MNTTFTPLDRLLHRFQSKAGRDAQRITDMGNVATLILAGGEGKRLFPLTTSNSKPALNFGGRYRIVDIPISNAINSGCREIYILTQFLSFSLQQHVINTYCRHNHNGNRVMMFSPEQTPGRQRWFEGTADAVRQNLNYFKESAADYFLILSGDQVYQIDFRYMLQMAKDTQADLVLAALPIKEQDCKRMGVLQVNEQSMITNFVEKPKDAQTIKNLELPKALREANFRNPDYHHLASMGIYLFKKEALINLLSSDDRHDFGMHLLPNIISKGNCAAYLFDGYWEDIGTIESFYQANIDLTHAAPIFHFQNENWPIFSAEQSLPPAKIISGDVRSSIVSEGCFIDSAEICDSIIGPRTHIQRGCSIKASYLMGYESHSSDASAHPPLRRIGQDCIIHKTIIDKDVSLGDGVQLINRDHYTHYDGENIHIRNGIIIVPRGASLPNGFVL